MLSNESGNPVISPRRSKSPRRGGAGAILRIFAAVGVSCAPASADPSCLALTCCRARKNISGHLRDIPRFANPLKPQDAQNALTQGPTRRLLRHIEPSGAAWRIRNSPEGRAAPHLILSTLRASDFRFNWLRPQCLAFEFICAFPIQCAQLF